MAEINTSYLPRSGPGGVTTTARGNDYAYSPLSAESRASLEQMLRARQAAMRPAAAARPTATVKESPYANDPNLKLRQAAEAAELHNRIVAAQAMERPAPTRLVTGPNVTPGYVMDPNAMSAIQRKLFLPDSATGGDLFGGGGGGGGGTSVNLSQNDPRNPFGNAVREGVTRAGGYLMPQQEEQQARR